MSIIYCKKCHKTLNSDLFPKKRRVCIACYKKQMKKANQTKRNKKRNNIHQKLYMRKRFFYFRATCVMNRCRDNNIKNNHTLIELTKLLFSLWHIQKGCCALTGIKLNRKTAHLDHIIPRSRGGDECISNYRWVCKDFNKSKGQLYDYEFFDMIDKIRSHTHIGNICPHCKNGILQYVGPNEPYSNAHLQCERCDSTFNIENC